MNSWIVFTDKTEAIADNLFHKSQDKFLLNVCSGELLKSPNPLNRYTLLDIDQPGHSKYKALKLLPVGSVMLKHWSLEYLEKIYLSKGGLGYVKINTEKLMFDSGFCDIRPKSKRQLLLDASIEKFNIQWENVFYIYKNFLVLRGTMVR